MGAGHTVAFRQPPVAGVAPRKRPASSRGLSLRAGRGAPAPQTTKCGTRAPRGFCRKESRACQRGPALLGQALGCGGPSRPRVGGRAWPCPPREITGGPTFLHTGPTKNEMWDPRSARVLRKFVLSRRGAAAPQAERGPHISSRRPHICSRWPHRSEDRNGSEFAGKFQKPCTPAVSNTSGPTFGFPKENPFVERFKRTLQDMFNNHDLDLLLTDLDLEAASSPNSSSAQAPTPPPRQETQNPFQVFFKSTKA